LHATTHATHNYKVLNLYEILAKDNIKNNAKSKLSLSLPLLTSPPAAVDPLQRPKNDLCVTSYSS